MGGAETDPEDVRLAEECWEAGRQAIYGGNYDLVVLDEINYTINYKMLDAEKVAEALKGRTVACTAGLRTKSSLSCASPTFLATIDDAIANCRLNFASRAVCGRSLRSISICVAPVETEMRSTSAGLRSCCVVSPRAASMARWVA